MNDKEQKDTSHKTEETAENTAEEQAHTTVDEATEESTQEVPTEDQLQALQQENDELRDKYLRLAAEFDNYKRRMVKEKMQMMSNAAQDTMSALLPVLDDFDRAKKAAEQNDKGHLFEEGIGLVYRKLYTTLKQKGLEPMDSEGHDFDPEFHEALTEIPAPSEDMKGKVVDVVERGYTLNGNIIRHAKVVVGK
ncbi:MAG: nucleotide exchange factor GrpE [Bacteroidetes bacterium]|jgi:molecular chaperone GrpE|nr:nucleotide exchange factor GrpE [Bacteroidota bacterium]